MTELQKGAHFKVLDHGYVKFIDSMGSDEVIVEAARMSTGRGFIDWGPYRRCKKCDLVESTEGRFSSFYVANRVGGYPEDHPHDWENYLIGDAGLLDNLWRHKHATPFEMGELALEIQAPIFVFREWHRHRTQSFNEFSARYSAMPNLHYVPEIDRFTLQSNFNKQGSGEVLARDAEAYHRNTEIEQQQIYDNYEVMLGAGVAKEVARINTPVSRYSKMRAKTDLRNWLAFCNLRMRPNAQWEIRQYAEIVGNIIKSIWPRTWELFEEYDLYGVTLSRSEMAILRRNISMGGLAMDAGAELKGTKLKEFITKMEKGGLAIL